MTNWTMAEQVFGVFTSIGQWLVESLQSIQPLFWTDNGLTFIGVLSVASLGVGLSLLLVHTVQNFIKFR